MKRVHVSKFQCVLRICLLFAALLPDTSRAALVSLRSQTLEGWHELVFSTTWSDLDPDVKQNVSTDVNGDLRGFDHPTATVWLQSPEFILNDGGSISISQIYLMANSEAAPLTVAGVYGAKSATGWAGIALIDRDGNFVLTYSNATEWQSVDLVWANLQGLAGKELTLNFISMNNSSPDFMYVNRPITIDGVLTSAIPEPSVALLACASLALACRRRR